MAKRAFLKKNPNFKHAGGQTADVDPARLKDYYPIIDYSNVVELSSLMQVCLTVSLS